MTGKKLMACIVDKHPRFYWEFINWYYCCDAYLDSNVFDCKVYFIGPVPEDILDFCAQHNIQKVVTDTFHVESPHCNKILPYLDEANASYDHVIVTDSDWYVVEDIQYYCNDQIRLAPNNSNNPPLPVFERIYQKLGMTDKIAAGVSLFASKHSRESHIHNVSGGITIIPKAHFAHFGANWAKWALWLIENRALLGKWRVHVDQVATAITVDDMDTFIHFLPPQTNTVLELLKDVRTVSAFHIAKTHREHFHYFFDEEGCLDSSQFNPGLAGSILKLNDCIKKTKETAQTLPTLLAFDYYLNNEKSLKVKYAGPESHYTKKPKRNLELQDKIGQIKALKVSDREIIAYLRNSGHFDEQYYLEQNEDIAASGIDPIVHYVKSGHTENRDPSKAFDNKGYKNFYKEVKLTKLNPFYHYLTFGRAQDYNPKPGVFRLDQKELGSTVIDSTCEAQKSLVGKSDIRPVAFYLPQFHEIPENNEWWGKGFTEWTHVRSGLPKFKGHHQPRIPHPDLGYYDLSTPDMLYRQAEMAKRSGMYGFSFYYYSFSDSRLLETPIEHLYANKDIDIHYNIFWANHPWTKTWYGQKREILKSIDYTPDFYKKFIQEASKYLTDERYIRIDGKPVIMLLHHKGGDGPPSPSECRRMTDIWREHCFHEGIGDIHIMFSQLDLTKDHNESFRGLGFDGCFEFAPAVELWGGLTNRIFEHKTSANFKGAIYEYLDLIHRRNATREEAAHRLYPTLITEWDNTARYGNKSSIFRNCNPLLFKEWLEKSIQYLDENYLKTEEKYLFINGWNEWSEGSYLEPDTKNGYAYLNAVCDVLQERINAR